jgi:hypothetical protein
MAACVAVAAALVPAAAEAAEAAAQQQDKPDGGALVLPDVLHASERMMQLLHKNRLCSSNTSALMACWAT